MHVCEPACLRRVFNHHIVRQATPPIARVLRPSEGNGRITAETKPPSDQEFRFASSRTSALCMFLAHLGPKPDFCISGVTELGTIASVSLCSHNRSDDSHDAPKGAKSP
jgi:hypothetical protein